jgi:hypothetical protein
MPGDHHKADALEGGAHLRYDARTLYFAAGLEQPEVNHRKMRGHEETPGLTMEAYTNAALTNLPREGFEHPDRLRRAI